MHPDHAQRSGDGYARLVAAALEGPADDVLISSSDERLTRSETASRLDDLGNRLAEAGG